MKQTTKFGESSQQHITNLYLFFFICECLAQAEEPGLIPVFPLSSNAMVYVTYTSNISLSEVTSTLTCPKNPQVGKEYSQSSKSSIPNTGSAWAIHLNCDSTLNIVKHCKGKAFLSEYSGLFNYFIIAQHAEAMISTTGMGHLPDYRWPAVTDTVSLFEGPGVEQGEYHTSLARVKGSKMLPSQTYLQYCSEKAETLHLARY